MALFLSEAPLLTGEFFHSWEGGGGGGGEYFGRRGEGNIGATRREGREKKQQKFMIIVMECLENVKEKRKETATDDFFGL